MQRAASAPNFSALTVATPEIRPSAGVLRMRSSTLRRRRWAAIASEPYSTKEPSSTRCAMFSRAVRWLVLRRRSTEAGRFSSSVMAWRSISSARSGRMWSRSTSSSSVDVMGVDLGRLEIQDRLVLHQRHAGFGRDLRHPAAMRRGHQMLHLHGFEHGDLLAGADEVSLPDIDGDDRALQRRRHRDRAGRPGCRCRDRKRERRRHRRRCRIRSAPSRAVAWPRRRDRRHGCR